MSTTNILAQMAAFFADKEGAPINVLKLMKLMYLADRESMRRYGSPISLDNMVSMQHGPVLSQTLNLINGSVQGAEGELWNQWISARENYLVELRKPVTRGDLDHLSECDLNVLEGVWEKFGDMNQWELRDYTHEHCAEWQDPESMGRGSLPIDEVEVLRAVEIPEKEAVLLAKDLVEQKLLNRYFKLLDADVA